MHARETTTYSTAHLACSHLPLSALFAIVCLFGEKYAHRSMPAGGSYTCVLHNMLTARLRMLATAVDYNLYFLISRRYLCTSAVLVRAPSVNFTSSSVPRPEGQSVLVE